MSCECACHRLGVESIEVDCRCRKTPLGLCLERTAPLGAQNDYAMFCENFEGLIGLPDLTDDPAGDR